jgi:hypothetical protein
LFARQLISFAGRQIAQGDEVEELWALKDASLEIRQLKLLIWIRIVALLRRPTAEFLSIRN